MDKMRSVIKSEPAHATSTCTALLNQLKFFAGNQIRNTASVGGNIVTGSPISDTCPLYMACGATFVLQGQGMPERQVLAEDFFLDYRSVASYYACEHSLQPADCMQGQMCFFKCARLARHDDTLAALHRGQSQT